MIHIRSFFEYDKIFYSKVFLRKCLYNLIKSNDNNIWSDNNSDDDDDDNNQYADEQFLQHF